jgi:hypothetical protein
MVSKKWCLRYLEGRASGFTHGTLTVNHVKGAVRMCLSHGIGLEHIAAVLRLFDLGWDAANASLQPFPSFPVSRAGRTRHVP